MICSFVRPLGIGALVCLCLAACSPETPPAAVMAPSLPENPLPPCPSSPNCVRQTRAFALPADTLFGRAQHALEAIGPSTLNADPEARRLDAVFTVVFFKDDVALHVEPHEEGAVLHIRSASRVGYSALGVNRRRVARFFRALDDFGF